MQMSGNTVLITGGGTGIGRGLAEAFYAEGNQVIIAGRRKEQLASTVAAHPGMKAAQLDVADPDSIRSFAEDIKREHPGLNVVIHNAGISRLESVRSADTAVAEAIVATNLLGPIRLNAALLPAIENQPHPVVMTVSSGLAMVPLSLGHLLRHKGGHSLLHAVATLPIERQRRAGYRNHPAVCSNRTGGTQQAKDPNAMPLKNFIAEVMQILKASPDATEVCVERVKAMRFAEAGGRYDAFFKQFNDSALARHNLAAGQAAKTN